MRQFTAWGRLAEDGNRQHCHFRDTRSGSGEDRSGEKFRARAENSVDFIPALASRMFKQRAPWRQERKGRPGPGKRAARKQ